MCLVFNSEIYFSYCTQILLSEISWTEISVFVVWTITSRCLTLPIRRHSINILFDFVLLYLFHIASWIACSTFVSQFTDFQLSVAGGFEAHFLVLRNILSISKIRMIWRPFNICHGVWLSQVEVGLVFSVLFIPILVRCILLHLTLSLLLKLFFLFEMISLFFFVVLFFFFICFFLWDLFVKRCFHGLAVF